MSLVQSINIFFRKWGDIVWVSIGIVIIIATAVLQVIGVKYYEFYDTRRYHAVIRVPVFTNYLLGLLFIVLSFNRKWIASGRKKQEE